MRKEEKERFLASAAAAAAVEFVAISLPFVYPARYLVRAIREEE